MADEGTRASRDRAAAVSTEGSTPPSGLRFYWLEEYLFVDVCRRFQAERQLGAFDFFSIIIWKSNRAKSKVAHRLLDAQKEHGDLEAIVRKLTRDLADASDRLACIMKTWGFQLPLASAILTVLWPDEFSVFDVRACEALRSLGKEDFSKLASRTHSPTLAADYRRFVDSVRSIDAEGCTSLRDKDRYLWGKSASDQLRRDIVSGFAKKHTPTGTPRREPRDSRQDSRPCSCGEMAPRKSRVAQEPAGTTRCLAVGRSP
jgi:hypothetical protein